jgi:hypothetical protein
MYSRAPVSTNLVIRGLSQPEKKIENYRNKRLISFKTRAKKELAITWWNPAA